MKIIYSRAAYISDIGAEMLDNISNVLNGWAEGAENYCVTYETMIEWLEEFGKKAKWKTEDRETYILLCKLKRKIEGFTEMLYMEEGVGDIIFSQ